MFPGLPYVWVDTQTIVRVVDVWVDTLDFLEEMGRGWDVWFQDLRQIRKVPGLS